MMDAKKKGLVTMRVSEAVAKHESTVVLANPRGLMATHAQLAQSIQIVVPAKARAQWR